MTCLQPSNAANDNRPLPTKLERKGLIIMITLIISYVLTEQSRYMVCDEGENPGYSGIIQNREQGVFP